MKKLETKILACDFETTVYDGQEFTEVWAAGWAELFNSAFENDANIFSSFPDFWNSLINFAKRENAHIRAYFHNLKFDGHFIIDALMRAGYTPALEAYDGGVNYLREKDLKSGEFTTLISDTGQWYSLTVRVKYGYLIEFRDSLKLIPMPLEAACKGFDVPHKKLTMVYEGERHAGMAIPESDRTYLVNDVLGLKECLEVVYSRGHDKLTIGACCMNEYKKLYGGGSFYRDFPNLENITLDPEEYGAPNADTYIRKAYKGGWCYCDDRAKTRTHKHGIVLDVNSLYPSVMEGESGNTYPIGLPHFFKGRINPLFMRDPRFYWFVRIRTRFRIKKDHLPFIQLKNTYRFRATEYLKSSVSFDGVDEPVELTLTMTDYNLLLEHYDLRDTEYLDGVYFWSKRGIFDDYISIYKKQKIEAKTPADRLIAKLFQNNLYGKFAARSDSSFKYPTLGIYDDSILVFRSQFEQKRKPGYIAVGAAVTSYARAFTIRAAQANYDRFNYSDTDSIHLDGFVDDVKGVTIDDKKYLCWKCEGEFTDARYIRQKTYAEKISGEWKITCAGLPTHSKRLFLAACGYIDLNDFEKQTLKENEIAFIKKGIKEKWTIDNFNIGVVIPGKLRPKVIPGGVILTEINFEMR